MPVSSRGGRVSVTGGVQLSPLATTNVHGAPLAPCVRHLLPFFDSSIWYCRFVVGVCVTVMVTVVLRQAPFPADNGREIASKTGMEGVYTPVEDDVLLLFRSVSSMISEYRVSHPPACRLDTRAIWPPITNRDRAQLRERVAEQLPLILVRG